MKVPVPLLCGSDGGVAATKIFMQQWILNYVIFVFIFSLILNF